VASDDGVLLKMARIVAGDGDGGRWLETAMDDGRRQQWTMAGDGKELQKTMVGEGGGLPNMVTNGRLGRTVADSGLCSAVVGDW
jgi:hypothetical protein